MRKLVALLFAVGALVGVGATSATAAPKPNTNCSIGPFVTHSTSGSTETYHACKNA
jgi:hypothetical protein